LGALAIVTVGIVDRSNTRHARLLRVEQGKVDLLSEPGEEAEFPLDGAGVVFFGFGERDQGWFGEEERAGFDFAEGEDAEAAVGGFLDLDERLLRRGIGICFRIRWLA
jgi:hypothetical protein